MRENPDRKKEPIQKQPRKVFYKKAVLKNFAIFTRERLCLFNKVAGLHSL